MPERGDSAPYDRWLADLERRHLAELTFPEVSRALRALSATYVERRQKIAEGAALAGAGKRAAFAMFYGPLHFLLVAHIAGELPGAAGEHSTLVDLGCGTGASAAAWATACSRPPAIVGIDRHPWALDESKETFRAFGLSARTRLARRGRSRARAAGALRASSESTGIRGRSRKRRTRIAR